MCVSDIKRRTERNVKVDNNNSMNLRERQCMFLHHRVRETVTVIEIDEEIKRKAGNYLFK